jgi:N-methylhydantoinase A
MGYRISVDTGGTFTDVVCGGPDGSVTLSKASTTPDRIFDGISQAVAYAAEEIGVTAGELLAQTDVFTYGTTRATNAVITGNTARTALLTTKGFADVLVYREAGKMNPFDLRQTYREPYIPRRLTWEIDERILTDGSIAEPLQADQVRSVLAELKEAEVEAVAVCLLWSIANGEHETAIGDLIAEELPGVPYTLSHRLNPIMREYRRASSAAIDASLKPLMQDHFRGLERDLTEAGFAGQLLIVTSVGGVLELDDVTERPLYSVNSGPAMAPVAGKAAAHPVNDLIVCDTGGTSFDVSVVRDGYISFTRETWLNEVFTGHITGLSSVDVHNVGAGGGSIAWIDPGGLLRVGPQSAGAVPGPVCYGAGGTSPTVTDAALTLGYIDPEYFLGGRLSVDSDAARAAIERDIATPLGMSVERAAWSILAVANEHMVTAIRDITVDQGIDPRKSLLVAGGGAGGLTVGRIAAELGCDRVLVPHTAPALSACGGMYANIVTEFTASLTVETGSFDFDAVNKVLSGLDADMDRFFANLDVDEERRTKEFFVEARYPYQVWELDVPLPMSRFDSPEDVKALENAFHEVHHRVFAVKEPDQQVEGIYWKARATAHLADVDVTGKAREAQGDEPASHRRTWWGDDEPVDAPIYMGEQLKAGTRLSGPAVVELPMTTIVVYPDWSLEVTDVGDYSLVRDGTEAADGRQLADTAVAG